MCGTWQLFFDGSCMSHMTASAIITEPSNIHPQNNSSFDGSHGNGTLNSFDFLIVCEKVKCACSGRMREFSIVLFMPFLCNVTHIYTAYSYNGTV